MSGPDRVPVPGLGSRTATIWAVGTGVAVVASLVWGWVAQPQHRVAVLVEAAVLLVLVIWLASLRSWVEPATGTLVRESFRCRQRRSELRSARKIALVNNRGGNLLLGITHRRTFYVKILALTDYVERSQPPEFLRFLADQLDAHAPRARTVAAQLRGQADFLARGGTPAESPLAGLVTFGALRAAKAGSVGGLFH